MYWLVWCKKDEGGIEIKEIVHEEDIIIDDNNYKLTYYDDDTSSLKRLNKKYNMWVEINFTNNHIEEIDKSIKEILCNNFINKMVC